MKLADKSIGEVRVKEPELRRAFEVMTSSETLDWSNMDVSIETHDIIGLIQNVKDNEMKRKYKDMDSQNRRRNY